MRGIIRKIKAINFSPFILAAIISLLICDYCISVTGALSGLPSWFGAAVHAVFIIFALLEINFKDEDNRRVRIVLFVLAGAGLIVYAMTGYAYFLDTALILMCVFNGQLQILLSSVFCSNTVLVAGVTLCARRGYIREYTFGGYDALGFESFSALVFLCVVAVAALIALLVVMTRGKEWKNLKLIVTYVVSAAICVICIFLAVNTLPRTKPLVDGSYAVYSGDLVTGLEIRMHGIENYDLVTGNDIYEFSFTSNGSYYEITADCDGVRKSVCVYDNSVYLGNYDESQAAHTWLVEAVPGTPYFKITNVETGLLINTETNGKIRMSTEGSLLRIGDGCIDYFRGLTTNAWTQEDFSAKSIEDAKITLSGDTSYTGEAVIPDIEVKYGEDVLIQGNDYTVEYADNFYPGTASVILTGKGSYAGSIETKFEITFNSEEKNRKNYENVLDYALLTYRMGYGRLPDSEELEQWIYKIYSELFEPREVVNYMYDNGAFDCSDGEFAEAIYRLLLLRNASRSELEPWVNALRSGSSRYDVIRQFINSDDYQHNVSMDFYYGFR